MTGESHVLIRVLAIVLLVVPMSARTVLGQEVVAPSALIAPEKALESPDDIEIFLSTLENANTAVVLLYQQRWVEAVDPGCPSEFMPTVIDVKATDFEPWTQSVFVDINACGPEAPYPVQVVADQNSTLTHERLFAGGTAAVDHLSQLGAIGIELSLHARSHYRVRFIATQTVQYELSGVLDAGVTTTAQGCDTEFAASATVTLCRVGGVPLFSESAGVLTDCDSQHDTQILARQGNLTVGVYELDVDVVASSHGTGLSEFETATPEGAHVVILEFTAGAEPTCGGDLDLDGDVDLADYALFVVEFTGPNP